MAPGSSVEEYHQDIIGVDATIEVWCTEEEVEETGIFEPEPIDTDGLSDSPPE
jgi:hypothetical protein